MNSMWWPPYRSIAGMIHQALFLILSALTAFNYMMATTSGPGFLPFKWEPKVILEMDKHSNFVKLICDLLFYFKDKRGKKMLQYCNVCEGYKAPRSHHCRKCQRCVMKMDHHCPWLNTVNYYLNWNVRLCDNKLKYFFFLWRSVLDGIIMHILRISLHFPYLVAFNQQSFWALQCTEGYTIHGMHNGISCNNKQKRNGNWVSICIFHVQFYSSLSSGTCIRINCIWPPYNLVWSVWACVYSVWVCRWVW